MKIVLCYPVEEKHLKQIQTGANGATVINAGQEHIAEAIFEADIFCGHAKVPVPWADVVQQGRLKWIQSSAAGVDHCLTPEVQKSDIVVTSASGVLADQVAEHTLALLGALFRGLPTFFHAQLNKEYIRRPTRDLHNTTIGIVGFGGNGQRIAELLKPYHVNILATDWFNEGLPQSAKNLADEIFPAEALEDIIPRIDALILTAPLTNSTRNLINDTRLDLFQSYAFLVNVARGELVDEQALVSALNKKQLAGAGLDVAVTEPLPQESPLWNQPNIILTPHVGGQSIRRIDQMTDFFTLNLGRFLRSEPLLNLVEKDLGFPHPRDAYCSSNKEI